MIAFLTGCFGIESQKTGKEGKTLPSFSLLLTDSTTAINTRNINPEQPLIFIYFSPYCPYCKAQTKEIINNMDELKNIQFYFVTNFPMTSVKKFQKEFELAKYSNIHIGVDTSHFLSNYFEIRGTPYVAIYDKSKALKKSYMGKLYTSQLIKATED
jgi:thiol-disulfide isomerase/thioredoxin